MRAFTMIELIITIVIVGIVSLSFPMIMTQTSNNILVATQQEAILAAKTYMGTILSYPWDENTYADGKGMILETDSVTMSSDSEFDRVIGTNLRPGNIDGSGRRRLADNSSANRNPAGVIGSDGGDMDDLDDFNGAIRDLNIAAEDMDYIFRLRLTPAVRYVDDRANYTNQTLAFNLNTASADNRTNIKMISMNVINATSSSPNVNITLRAYSSNIGEVELLKKIRGDW